MNPDHSTEPVFDLYWNACGVCPRSHANRNVGPLSSAMVRAWMVYEPTNGGSEHLNVRLAVPR